MVRICYLLLTEKYENDSFIFMGDSAGGNIILAFIQKLIDEDISKLPIKNILFSPCVDLTFSNPEIKEVEHLDFILTRELLQYGADQYANGDDLNHYLLSPINGDLNNFPETVIFYGSHEILMPDILRFKARAERTGARIFFHEYDSMQHDWILFSIPERKRVIQEVVGIIGT
jgi:acetyl esterase/lipase